MKLIPSQGIWNLLPDFLTKNRYLGKRTKIVLSWIIVIAVVAGYFEPGIEGFDDWMTHKRGLYQSSRITMPVFWTQDTWHSWKRPSTRMLSLNDGDLDIVEIGPNGMSSRFLYTAKAVTKDTDLSLLTWVDKIEAGDCYAGMGCRRSKPNDSPIQQP